MNYNRLLRDILTLQADESRRELTGIGWTQGRWRTTKIGAAVLMQDITIAHIADVRSALSGSERKANATLIATAPLLYQALDNLIISSYDPDEGDCLICGAQCAWGAAPHEEDCEVAAAAGILALARGEKQG